MRNSSYRLTANDRKVISALQHDSRLAVNKVAAKAKMKAHSVIYCLKRLKELEILKPYLLTNPHAIGLTDYCVFFNYAGKELKARRKIIDYCLTSPQVAYFAELTGTYQYTVSLFCRTIFEVTDFFSRMGAKLPKSSFHSSFAIRLQFTQLLGRLYDPKAVPVIVSRARVTPEVTIDSTDRSILAFYSQNAGLPLRSVAAAAKISESAVRYRLEAMEKNKVIHSYPYLLDVNKAGMSTFRMILAANSLEDGLANDMLNFMKRHARASAFVHCAGSWDFELSFDVEDNTEMGSIIEDVNDNFGDKVKVIHTLNEIAVHRAHHFPLNAGINT